MTDRKERIRELIAVGIEETVSGIGASQQLSLFQQLGGNPWAAEVLPALSALQSVTQSIVIRLGYLWTNLATSLAAGNWEEAAPSHSVKGALSSDAASELEGILDELRAGAALSPEEQRARLLEAQAHISMDDLAGDLEPINLLLRRGAEQWLVELETTGKVDSRAVETTKRRLLRAFALQNDPATRFLLGVLVNPYGEGSEYSYRRVLKFFAPGEDLLVGEELWDFLGGQGTYADISAALKEVGAQFEAAAVQQVNRALDQLGAGRVRLTATQ